jgi:hypothetical protein
VRGNRTNIRRPVLKFPLNAGHDERIVPSKRIVECAERPELPITCHNPPQRDMRRAYRWKTPQVVVHKPECGAIAQLGERIVRNDEVVGSIPTSSTKFFN